MNPLKEKLTFSIFTSDSLMSCSMDYLYSVGRFQILRWCQHLALCHLTRVKYNRSSDLIHTAPVPVQWTRLLTATAQSRLNLTSERRRSAVHHVHLPNPVSHGGGQVNMVESTGTYRYSSGRTTTVDRCILYSQKLTYTGKLAGSNFPVYSRMVLCGCWPVICYLLSVYYRT